MNTIARILVRKDSEVGLFIPMRGHSLKPGLYNLREIFGEHELVYVGSPAMQWEQIDGLSPNELLDWRESTLMTEAESHSLANRK